MYHDIYYCDTYYRGAQGRSGRQTEPNVHSETELEYRIPRLHSLANSRRFPEISVRTKQVSCRYLLETVSSRRFP